MTAAPFVPRAGGASRNRWLVATRAFFGGSNYAAWAKRQTDAVARDAFAHFGADGLALVRVVAGEARLELLTWGTQ